MAKLVFETAGFSDTDKMWFEPGIAECGEITDGVVFGHDDAGGFVVDYADLERCYLLAKNERGK